MADINPYAGGSHDPSADTPSSTRSIRIYSFVAIALLILGCGLFLSVRRQPQSEPIEVGMIPEPDLGLTLTSENAVVLFMTTAGDGSVAVTRQDGTAFNSDEAIQASEIIEYLDQELSAGKGKNQVLILGDADIRVAEVTRVQRIMGGAFEDLSSTYVAVKEEK